MAELSSIEEYQWKPILKQDSCQVNETEATLKG